MTSKIAPFAHIDIWSLNILIAEEVEPVAAKSNLMLHPKMRRGPLALDFAKSYNDENTESGHVFAMKSEEREAFGNLLVPMTVVRHSRRALLLDTEVQCCDLGP